jgi:ketosteroid isomerase-like protein
MKFKNIIFYCIILTGYFSCSVPSEKAITNEQKAKIETEVRAIVDSISSSASELRTDYFKKIYWNDDDFTAIWEGVTDYDEYIEQTDEMYSTMKSLNFMEDDVSVVVYDEKTAIALFSGKAKGESKDGVKMNLNNFNASMLFRNVEGNWKIVFTHESAEQEIIMPEDESDSEDTNME